jgi:Beta-1,3-glucanase
VSAVDAIGVPMQLTAVQPGQAPLGPVGLAPNAGTNVALGLSLLGAPWSSLVQSYASGTHVRVINPSHAVASPLLNGGLNFPASYLSAYMSQMCQTYSTTDMMVGGSNPGGLFIPSVPMAYGRYTPGTCGTPGQTLNFYTTPTSPNVMPTGTPIATFTGVPATVDALDNAGYFNQTVTDPGLTIGRIMSVGIDRSTYTQPMGSTPQSFAAATSFVQPVCAMGSGVFYGGSITNGGAVLNPGITTNWYSALAHQYAFNNSVYAFADDDECSIYAPFVSYTNFSPYPTGTQIQVTIEPF